MFVYSTNPAVVAPEGNKVRQGLLREDLFLVVHDLFLTETARYADIVLPATSSYENTDFFASYWHHFIQLQQPVIKPYGESKSNVDVFRLLAKGMGFDDALFEETEKDMIDQALDDESNPFIRGIRYDSLAEEQFIKAKVEPMFPGTLPTPSGKIELYSEQMKQDGYPPLPTYVPLQDDEGGPYLFIPAPNHQFLNSTFSNNEKHERMAKEASLYMNEKDAEASGIQDGEQVRVWNSRGECMLTAAVGEHVLPGVVVSQGLWADKAGTKQLVNSLTPDRLSDMGGGAVFFSGRVNVSKMAR